MSRAISEMFDQDVALDDTENFEEVLYRITHVFDRLKNKKGAKDFIFGESIVDVCDDIVAQFPSLKMSKSHTSNRLSMKHWSICGGR